MKIIIASGYFNPTHTGHLDYLLDAKARGDKLIVIVNNDQQVQLKGSVPFLDEKSRLRLVENLKPVDQAILSIDTDKSVVETLSMIKDMYISDSVTNNAINELYFANGGDRTGENTPESAFCLENNIVTLYNIGGGKTQSSSELLERVR